MMIVHVYDTIYVTQFEFITLFTWFTATIWYWYNYVHIQMRKLKSEEFICLNPVSCVVRYRSKIWISHLSPNQLIQNYFPCSKIRHCVSVSMISSLQFSSVTQSCLTLCDPMNHSTPDLPVHHQLPEFTQTHTHRVGDAIQPSHPLSSPSPPAPVPPSIKIFSNQSALRMRWQKLEFQLQHQSFQWTPRTHLL